MTILRRLTILEQRLQPPPPAPPPSASFDHDAYAAWYRDRETWTPDALAAECAEALTAAAWHEWPGFDWPSFTSVYYEQLAGNPGNWQELLAAAQQR